MRSDIVRRARQFMFLVVVAGVLAAGVSAWQSARAGSGPAWLQRLAGPPQTLVGLHVGIISGHRGYDTGTVCPDGLTEASVNQGIADLVVRGLGQRGAQVDLLDEYDDRLPGYRADAMVSIHTDSCESDFSGYKVASLTGGSDASARLAACLWDRYGSATGLPRHVDTITDDMRLYHAFRQVAAATPAAIIETGFLKADRALLTDRRDLAADGIIGGIECFLAPTGPATRTPSVTR